MNTTIYRINHPTIEFSSINPNLVSFYEEALKDISAEDIKMDRLEGRHGLMMNLWRGGNCPLSEEYMAILDKRDKMVEGRMENAKIPWNSCEFSVRRELADEVDLVILDKYAWDFTNWQR